MNQATIVMLLAFIMLVITTSVVMISTHEYVQAQLTPEKNASQIASELQTDVCLPYWCIEVEYKVRPQLF